MIQEEIFGIPHLDDVSVFPTSFWMFFFSNPIRSIPQRPTRRLLPNHHQVTSSSRPRSPSCREPSPHRWVLAKLAQPHRWAKQTVRPVAPWRALVEFSEPNFQRMQPERHLKEPPGKPKTPQIKGQTTYQLVQFLDPTICEEFFLKFCILYQCQTNCD